jgi:hypothetical protein
MSAWKLYGGSSPYDFRGLGISDLDFVVSNHRTLTPNEMAETHQTAYNSPVAPVTFLQIVIGLIPSPRAPQFFQMGIAVKLGILMAGFIKLLRTPELPKLILKNPHAFALLTIIAYRTIRDKDRFDELEAGQARIGDWQNMGFKNRDSYRKAVTDLTKWGYILTKTSRKGTITSLIDSTIYDINPAEYPNSSPTAPHQVPNNAPLLKNDKKVKNDKNANNRATFVAPTVEQVQSYMTEKGTSDFNEAETFVDFYSSKGWLVGKAKMKNWKAAVRNWLKRKSNDKQPTSEIPAHQEYISDQPLTDIEARAVENSKRVLKIVNDLTEKVKL